MNPATMTGLELMQAMLEGKLPPPSISTTIPMQGVAIASGKVVFKARADERHLNPLGAVHGGFAATVMDTVTGCAVHTLLGAGEGYGTIDLNVKMMRPVPQRVDLVAEGHVLNISKSLAVSEGTLKDADGKLYAHATATCMLIRGR